MQKMDKIELARDGIKETSLRRWNHNKNLFHQEEIVNNTQTKPYIIGTSSLLALTQCNKQNQLEKITGETLS